MSDQLSGRDLEIAVAKALGWTAIENYDGLYDSVDPHGEREKWKLPETMLWETAAPAYLTDPAAFAEVLAAIRDAEASWGMYSGSNYSSAQIGVSDYARDGRGEGATYQEAMCRAFVAWKGEA